MEKTLRLILNEWQELKVDQTRFRKSQDELKPSMSQLQEAQVDRREKFQQTQEEMKERQQRLSQDVKTIKEHLFSCLGMYFESVENHIDEKTKELKIVLEEQQ